MYSIEWQKRGLPYAHILIWLKDELRPTQIDSVILSEILDPQVDSIPHNNVTKHMIHSMCGAFKLNSSCMDKTKKFCRKICLLQFIQKTQMGNDSYPLYRSPDNGEFASLFE